jgi:Protein of unknown function (DUF4254)
LTPSFLLEKAGAVLDLFPTWIERWDVDDTQHAGGDEALTRLVLELHRYNYLLWHQEDIARRDDIDIEAIVNVKRNIDRLNQKRNDAIERVDEWLLDNHYGQLSNRQLPFRTETPGSVFDRLSILSLKVFHMREQTLRSGVTESHIDRCRRRLDMLLRQQQDLRQSLIEMLTDLNAGKIRMKVYRQFKMYNDPDLNPQLYGSRGD